MNRLFDKFTKKKKDTGDWLDDLSIEDENSAQMNDPEEEMRLKIVFIGSYCTGAKTSFTLRYVTGVYPNGTESTIGANFFVKNFVSRGKKVQLQIWDTAAFERHRMPTPLIFRGAAGIVVGYDITDRISFDTARQWFTSDKEKYSDNERTFMVIGNKVDLEEDRKISQEEGEELAREFGVSLFFEGK